jgi:2-iminobutanoate/2-iminopropanoate deaminase
MDTIQRISHPDHPAPAGHYSPAVRWRDLVFISGQLPTPPDGSPGDGLPFEEQALSALKKLLEIAEAAGSGPSDVLKVTAYIVGIENWGRFNAVYAQLFGEARPARAVVPVPELHHGYLVEVEGVAVPRR